MRVRCVATSLTSQQKALLRITTAATPEYQIIPGNTYLVLGITFIHPTAPHGGGIRYEILNDFGNCLGIPACLFEIEDARCSRYWLSRQNSDNALVLWPEAFLADYFHDDLSEGIAGAVDAFRRVVNQLKGEFE